MKKLDVEILLQALNLPKKHHYLGVGGSMVMHGLREETKDLDISVSHNLFKTLSLENTVTKAPMGGDMIDMMDGKVTLFPEELDHSKITHINGHPVETLESVRDWKIKRGRPKDLEDVELINKHLGGKL